MVITNLQLTNYRNHSHAEFDFDPQELNLIVGKNGSGKTNLLEAVGYLSLLKSFRGAQSDSVVQKGFGSAVLRGEGSDNERRITINLEISVVGKNKTIINGQPVSRNRDVLDVFSVVTFAPGDLELIQGGPSQRRQYVDYFIALMNTKNLALQNDLEKILRQRNTLLRQAGGKLSDDLVSTLDVWDERLASVGEDLVVQRQEFVKSLTPFAAEAYEQLSAQDAEVDIKYEKSWDGDLIESLRSMRAEEVKRGITLAGPHRDELDLSINGFKSRTECSQGEQRTLAFALKLAGHNLIRTNTSKSPVLLIDDVFSELDQDRCVALLSHLPPGQVLMTTTEVAPWMGPAKTIFMGDVAA